MAFPRIHAVALVVASLLSAAGAQQSTAASPSKPEPALDVTSMDRRIDPCVDFFEYSCGGWIKNNPIPPDQSSWDTYSKMQDENRGRLRGILEAASVPDPARNAAMQKIGDYYSSCMDEKAIEAKETDPLKPGLERIAKIDSKAEIADVAAVMVHSNALFRFDSAQDFRDADQVIAEADQGGLGLPDRDYYVKEDAKSVDLRKAYVAHLQKMFELLGDQPEDCSGGSADRNAHRNRASQRIDDPRRAARTEEPRPQDDYRRTGENQSRFSVAGLLHQGRAAVPRLAQRGRPRLLQGHE